MASEVESYGVRGRHFIDDSVPFATVTGQTMQQEDCISRPVEPLSGEMHVAVDDLNPLRVRHSKRVTEVVRPH
jgi:hypothetical protein